MVFQKVKMNYISFKRFVSPKVPALDFQNLVRGHMSQMTEKRHGLRAPWRCKAECDLSYEVRPFCFYFWYFVPLQKILYEAHGHTLHQV